MANVLNRTAKQFNLKCMGKKGNRVCARIAPGYNKVDDKVWGEFVDGKKVDPYVAELVEKKQIAFGPLVDDMEMDIKDDEIAEAETKSTPVPAPHKS